MRKAAILAAALVSSVFATTTALAHGRHHGHARVRVVIGAPVIVYKWFPPPPPRYVVLYSPPPRAWVGAAPVYVERDADRAAAADAGWYYYCPEARAYYPYVRHCPGGWQRVPPQPSD
ncbi:MAG: hypothetical protein N2653_04635 [Burkholderiales bacterium]|nr:hypothetical protein [Burkholderiales bacterium]